MIAEMTVAHREGLLANDLEKIFGPHDPTVLNRSASRGLRHWGNLIPYATETPQLRLICFPASTIELQLIIEPIRGDPKAACETVWNGIQHSSRRRKPKLRLLRMTERGLTIYSARTGLFAGIKRAELWPSLSTGLATGLWLTLSLSTFGRHARSGIILGTVPAIAAGVTALTYLILDHKRQRLVWSL